MPASQPYQQDDQHMQTIRFQSQPPHPQTVFDKLWSSKSDTWRKKFNQTGDKLKTFAKTKALVLFLKECLVKKVTPRTFEVKIKPDKRFSEAGQKKFMNHVTQIQNEHIKLAIKESQERESTEFLSYLNFKRDIKLMLNPSEVYILNEELDKRLSKFTANEQNSYKCKLLKLQARSQVTLPPHPPPTNNDVESNSDNPRHKKRRRFIKRSKYRCIQRKLSSKPLDNLVINYSKHLLTPDQNSLLNKHLSFVSVPDKVNLTELDYNYKRFSRSMRWRESFAHKKNEEPRPDDIFHEKKHNLPTHPSSRPLNDFLYGVKSDLLTLSSKKVYPNLTSSQKTALNQPIEE